MKGWRRMMVWGSESWWHTDDRSDGTWVCSPLPLPFQSILCTIRMTCISNNRVNLLLNNRLYHNVYWNYNHSLIFLILKIHISSWLHYYLYSHFHSVLYNCTCHRYLAVCANARHPIQLTTYIAVRMPWREFISNRWRKGLQRIV